MHTESEAVIVIPIYKKKLDDPEEFALHQVLNILGKYKIAVIKPRSLIMPDIFPEGMDFMVECFDDHYFSSTEGYNKLLLNVEFFLAFREFKYMLICQLDALPLKDELMQWVKKGYDYIGAPWPDKDVETNQACVYEVKSAFVLRAMAFINKVFFNKKDYSIGNGGFTLRNIAKHIRVLKLFHYFAKRWNTNEDVFWSVFIPLVYPFFKVPNLEDGVGFAFEKDPSFFYNLNKRQIPFGIHAFEKYDKEFCDFLISKSGGHIREEGLSGKG